MNVLFVGNIFHKIPFEYSSLMNKNTFSLSISIEVEKNFIRLENIEEDTRRTLQILLILLPGTPIL